MSTPFWQDYDNTIEICVAATDDGVVVAWPEFPWVAEGLTEGAQPYNDAYDEVVASNFPSVTRSNLLATGSSQTEPAAVSAGNDVQMLVTLNTTVANMPSLSTPTAGEIASWGPDTVDFFVQVTGTSVTPTWDDTGYGTQSGFDLGPLSVSFSDQGDGLWRIRLENIEDMQINGASNGDGIIEDNGDFADVANSEGTFFQGLTASQRYVSVATSFDIDGTPTEVQVGYISRFSFS